jgi:hypothetical protein
MQKNRKPNSVPNMGKYLQNIASNKTMKNIMQQKTKGENWATARKRMITEAERRRPSYIKHQEVGPRARQVRRKR